MSEIPWLSSRSGRPCRRCAAGGSRYTRREMPSFDMITPVRDSAVALAAGLDADIPYGHGGRVPSVAREPGTRLATLLLSLCVAAGLLDCGASDSGDATGPGWWYVSHWWRPIWRNPCCGRDGQCGWFLGDRGHGQWGQQFCGGRTLNGRCACHRRQLFSRRQLSYWRELCCWWELYRWRELCCWRELRHCRQRRDGRQLRDRRHGRPRRNKGHWR